MKQLLGLTILFSLLSLAAAASEQAPSAGSEVKLYDFTRSELSSRGRMPGLEVIFNNFAGQLLS